MTYVYWSALEAVLVPPAVVTETFTAPALPTGVVAVMEVSDTTVNGAAAAPKLTLVAAVNPLPLIVTDCPPVDGPDGGETAVTSGAAT